METLSRAACTLFVVLSLVACTADTGPDPRIAFAECLTSKNTVMYGAYWCPHCADQKGIFAKRAFEKVNYVECDPRGKDAKPEICKQKNIRGYPTWEFSDGSREERVLTLEELAKKTGCSLSEATAQ